MTVIISAGIGAFITAVGMLVGKLLDHHLKRKDKKEDTAEEKADEIANLKAAMQEINQVIVDVKFTLEKLENRFDNVEYTNRVILYDRIKHLGTKHIKHGTITFDDRRALRNLHDAYHNKCGGNGDLDLMMKAIDQLPLATFKDSLFLKGEKKND